MIGQLEQRHYAKHRYDDEMSSAHLDSYIESLDRGKMFSLRPTFAEFEKYRTTMDDQLHEGNLVAGFDIFNRFQQRLEERMKMWSKPCRNQVEAMDFTVDESFPVDADEWDWARTLRSWTTVGASASKMRC